MNRIFIPVRLWLLSGLLLSSVAFLSAQTARTPRETALRFLQESPTQFNLSQADVSDVAVVREYSSANNGVTHVWLQQQYHGTPVYNGVFGLHVKPDGKVVHTGHRFVSDLTKKVNTTAPSLSAGMALQLAMNDLGFQGFTLPAVRTKTNDRNWLFESGAISKSPIPVTACYALQKDGMLRLAWTMVIEQANSTALWNMRVDAQTGRILEKVNETLSCKTGASQATTVECDDNQQVVNFNPPPPDAGEQYNVFPLPIESPTFGNRSVVANPADPIASPFGWLDTNGQPGAEYTYTRGNNAWAFDDSVNDNTGSAAESADGGAALNFDFPFDGNMEPEQNRDAAITNLFYMNNKMHDITYHYGFTESAGNFQQNTYGHGGVGGDPVNANALDGSGTDNANFTPSVDGTPGKMQMYKWTRQGGKLLNVDAPGVISGAYETGVPTWGGVITSTPITAEGVVVNDGTGDPTLGCNTLINNVNGKIAMVDRGYCEFGHKALVAEQAGAIACIICAFDDNIPGMAAGVDGAAVTIPVVAMKKSDCDKMKQFAGAGLTLTLVQPSATGPDFYDGDIDNGIIAHEYGHGISNRLTGTGFGCLGNAENMGEGWSDFFALITTVQPGDVGTKKRGIGNYVLRQSTTATGIRRYPYSTDMSINPITFGTVAENTETHALGEIWAQVTWDLYWAMVDQYGYDADINNTTSGNSRAIQLVMDGMGLQPCNPGFISGRDAILLADELNNSSKDTCLIMNVFARRGMGIGASEGATDNAGDGVENFDPIPTCLKTVKITKTCTPTINPGETADFTITITNHKDEVAHNVTISDELPAGLTFVSASNGGALSNGHVVFNLGDMPTLQVKTVTYKAKFAGPDGSPLLFQDPLETDDQWLSIFTVGNSSFELQTATVKTGLKAWKIAEDVVKTDATVEYLDAVQITGTRPALRFWNQFKTEKGADAGFVEIRKTSEQTWRRFPIEKAFRNGYTGSVQYATLAIPFLTGYSGDSQGWEQSYIDLSDYIGQTVTFRFRFGSDDNTAVAEGAWIVDGLEIIDLINFDGEATVTTTEGDHASANAPERGVILNPGHITGAVEPTKNDFELFVQPNPANDFLHVTVGKALQGTVQVSLIATDGRVALQQSTTNMFAGQMLSLDVQNIPSGVYTVRFESATGSSVTKVVIR